MKKSICSIVVLLLSLSAIGQSNPAQIPQSPQVTVIRAGTLIDPRANEPKHNQVIVIRGDKIESVGDAASVQVPAGAKVIDLSNATVLPGLIESHTHIFLQGEDPALGGYDIQLLKFPLAYRAARATVSARRALEQGFTTIRDMETEGAGYGDVGIKMAVDQGYIPGPRIFTTTRGISTTGGYPLEGYAPEIQVPKGVQIIDGPVEARKAAREQTGPRRRLDQGLHDASFVDRQGRPPGLAADAYGGRTEGHRGRGAWLGTQGRLPRLQRRGTAPRARRRMRLHRARARA